MNVNAWLAVSTGGVLSEAPPVAATAPSVIVRSTARAMALRLLVLGVAFFVAGCDGNTPASQPAGTPCGDGAFFTACVHACGETNDSETAAATCVGGKYHCDAPLIPATACDPDAWPVSRLPCGPWVAGYDCGETCAVCDVTRGWTCGPCPDASAAGRM